MTSLRLEKGYRDFGVDIDNTDTPLAAGLGFAVAWDKPGGFVGRDALAKVRAEGAPRNRVVGLLAQDPDVDLFGNEPVRRDGRWVGYVRAAAYGHTVGAAVGLAQVSCPDGVTGEWLDGGRLHRADRRGRAGASPAADRAVLRSAAAAHPG